MSSLNGKAILITGSAGAFGRAFAENFLKSGCKVLLCDINEEDGLKSAKKLVSEFGESNVKFVLCDVTKDESFKGAYSECRNYFGRVDVLINNAGCVKEDDLQTNISLNLVSSVKGTELAMEYMSKDKGGDGGSVINIAGFVGLSNIPYFPYYSATKRAIIQYTTVIGHPFHYNYSGVLVQCICPSLVRSPLLDVTISNPYNEHCEEAVNTLIKKASLIEIEDITEALFKLIEDRKPGSVMALEFGKPPYYVDPFLES